MIGEEEKRRSTGSGRGLGGLIYNNLGSCGFGAWLVRSDGRRGVWGHPSGGIGFFLAEIFFSRYSNFIIVGKVSLFNLRLNHIILYCPAM